MARTQKLRGGTDIYTLRCSPVSYGILCRELYDPSKHQGDTVVQDEFVDLKWALGQVNWIVRQVRHATSLVGYFKLTSARERLFQQTKECVRSIDTR